MTDKPTDWTALDDAAFLEQLAAEAREREATEQTTRVRRKLAEAQGDRARRNAIAKHGSLEAAIEAEQESRERMLKRGMDTRAPEDNPDLKPWQRGKVAANRALMRERMFNRERATENPGNYLPGSKPSKPKPSKADAQRVAEQIHESQRQWGRRGNPSAMKRSHRR